MEFTHRGLTHMLGHLRQHRLHGLGQFARQAGVGGKAAAAVQGHLVAREQRRSVHVVLHESLGQHDIAHAHARADATGHASEHDLAHTKVLDQRGGGGGRGHLADAREHRHHRPTLPVALPEIAPGHTHALLVGHGVQQQGQFFVHGAHQADRGGAQGLLQNETAVPQDRRPV